MTDENDLSGLIIRAQSGFFFVLPDGRDQVVTCTLRGRLKNSRRSGDIAAVGDRVNFTLSTDGSGAINEICPRKNEIVRLQQPFP